MSGITVRVDGLPAAQKAVSGLTKGMRPKLQKATKAGANEFKASARAHARPLSRRLARSVSVRAGKRDRPSSVLTFRPKVAWFRHFIIQGTADHGPRRAKVIVFQGKGTGYREGLEGAIVAHHVRGVPPHPILERVFAERQQAASDAMAEALMKE